MHGTAITIAEEVRAGHRQALARAITLVESTRTDHRARAIEILELLMDRTGRLDPPGHLRRARSGEVDVHRRAWAVS